MSTKQELLDQIEVLKKKVNELDNPEFSIIEDWMKKGIKYFILDFDNDGDVEEYEFSSRHFNCRDELDNIDKSLINFGLAFETQEDARDFRYWLEMRNKLAKLAKFLNKSEKIDWNNEHQTKYVISFVSSGAARYGFNLSRAVIARSPFEIYCLDPSFLAKAIEQFGEKELIDFYTNYNL